MRPIRNFRIEFESNKKIRIGTSDSNRISKLRRSLGIPQIILKALHSTAHHLKSTAKYRRKPQIFITHKNYLNRLGQNCVGPFTCEGSSGRPHITFSRPQNTANHSWSTAYHHLKTRKHRKSLPKDRKSLFQEGRKLQNHIFHIATANQCCWLSQDHKIPQITAGRPKMRKS